MKNTPILGISTQCPVCDGPGWIPTPYAAANGKGDMGTMIVRVKCQACDGEGWRHGFQAPV